MKPFLLACLFAAALGGEELKVRLTWGHTAARPPIEKPRVVAGSPGVEILEERAVREAGTAGLEFTLAYPDEPPRRIQNLHIIWSDLIALSDADTARRLRQDAAFRANPAKLTVLLNEEGTRGFSVTADQLRDNRGLWIPSLGVYLTAAGVPLEEHRKELAAWKGRGVLDRIQAEPEPTLADYTARWEDMGHPGYTNPQQRGPGHIVCLTWDSAIAKFGIDRGAGVWNDYGNPDRFQFWFGFGDITQGITRTWKSQILKDGLPVIVTVFEDDGVRYEVEQFAYPLHGPPKERRGDIPMVLLQKVRVTNLRGTPRSLPLQMAHRRQFPSHLRFDILSARRGKALFVQESAHQRTLFAVEGLERVESGGTRDYQREQRRVDATGFLDLAPNGSAEFVVKLPSPPVKPEQLDSLTAIDYSAAREATLRYWTDYVARGARFEVPEKVVNDLFRATLWHALRLPRRHGGEGGSVSIDLPYSNFAYSQTGTPWPVNQAVYVDYMLYDLRGYHGISAEELLAQYRNNQEADGHVGGYANWGVYTPGMLYSVAKNYLLSRDRQALEKLLPASLKALDWCLNELKTAARRTGPTRGLFIAPLNDGTGEGVWAFNQAYMYAGLELFGRALEEAGHARAGEALAAARSVFEAVGRGFGAGTARSPLVQLRDHTWTPYVPCDANTPGRLLEQWYPTDVDTGAMHLVRLKALPARGELAGALVQDHEDNLFLKGWGIANEPVYNQHGTAHLLRDDAKAVVRTFYSYIASAFSHAALEPVEHRWTHGQYFGPPSTDGAWFELFRNMLVHEWEDNTLLLGQAAPRRWLENGKRIAVERAPSYYGPVNFTVESRAASGSIVSTAQVAGPRMPAALLIRLRHPDGRPLRSVTVNGKDWKDFDAGREWVRIARPEPRAYSIVASY